jgi:hypothetical protein
MRAYPARFLRVNSANPLIYNNSAQLYLNCRAGRPRSDPWGPPVLAALAAATLAQKNFGSPENVGQGMVPLAVPLGVLISLGPVDRRVSRLLPVP